MDEGCRRDTDVQTFGKSNHGDPDKIIRQFKGSRGEPRQFCSEKQGCFFFDAECLGGIVVFVGGRGYKAVSLLFTRFQAGGGFLLETVVFFQGKPFGGAQGNIGIYLIFIPVFYDVYILDPEAVAGAQHRAGIVGLINIFKHHGKMARAITEDVGELQKSFGGNKRPEKVNRLRDFVIFGAVGRLHRQQRRFKDKSKKNGLTCRKFRKKCNFAPPKFRKHGQ